jgi:hypothetical protein
MLRFLSHFRRRSSFVSSGSQNELHIEMEKEKKRKKVKSSREQEQLPITPLEILILYDSINELCLVILYFFNFFSFLITDSPIKASINGPAHLEQLILVGMKTKIFFFQKSYVQRIQIVFEKSKIPSGTFEVSISTFDDNEQNIKLVMKRTLSSKSFCKTENSFEFSMPTDFLGTGVLVAARQLEKEKDNSSTPIDYSDEDLQFAIYPTQPYQIFFFGSVLSNKWKKSKSSSRILYVCQSLSAIQQIFEILINPNFPISLRSVAVQLLYLLFQSSTDLFLEFVETFEVGSFLKSCYSFGNETTSIVATGILRKILSNSNIKLPHRIFRDACDLLPDVLSQCSTSVCIDQYFMLLEMLWDLNPTEIQQAMMSLFVTFARLLHKNRSYTENILHTYFGVSSLTLETTSFRLNSIEETSPQEDSFSNNLNLDEGLGIKVNCQVISKYPPNTSIRPSQSSHNFVLFSGLTSTYSKVGSIVLDLHSVIHISSVHIKLNFVFPDTKFHLRVDASNENTKIFPFPLYSRKTQPQKQNGNFPPHHIFHISCFRPHRFLQITVTPESNSNQECSLYFKVIQPKYSSSVTDQINPTIHNLEIELQNQYETTERCKRILLNFIENIAEPLTLKTSSTLQGNVLNYVKQFHEAQHVYHELFGFLETMKEKADLEQFITKKEEQNTDGPLWRRSDTRKQVMSELATPICDESSSSSPILNEKSEKRCRWIFCIYALGEILLKKYSIQKDHRDTLEGMNPNLRVCITLPDQRDKVQFYSELFEQLCLYQGQRIAELGVRVLIRELQNFLTTNEIVEWLLGRLFENCKRPRSIDQIFSQQRVLTLVEQQIFELEGFDSAYNFLLTFIETQIGMNDEDSYNSLLWMLLMFQNVHVGLKGSQNLHIDCKCASCGLSPICGVRYRCVNCVDFDLCQKCEGLMTKSRGFEHPTTHLFARIDKPLPLAPKISKPNSEVLLQDLYLSEGWVVDVSRADSFQRNVNHEVECRVCYEGIHGVRYKCLNCQDYDACEECVESKKVSHFVSHIFLKVIHPLPKKKNNPINLSSKMLQIENESVSESMNQESTTTMKEGLPTLPTPKALVETLLHPLLYGRPKKGLGMNNDEKEMRNDTDTKRIDGSFGSPMANFEKKHPPNSSLKHPLTGSLDAPRVRVGLRNSQSEKSDSEEQEFYEGREDIGIILSLLDSWASTTTIEDVPVELMILAFEIIPQLMRSMKETTSELLSRPCFDRLLRKAATSSSSSIFRMKFLRMMEKLFSPENYEIKILKDATLSNTYSMKYYQFLSHRHIATNIVSRISVHFLESFLISNELMMFFLTFWSIITKPLPFQEISFWNKEWKKETFQKNNNLNGEVKVLRGSLPEESRVFGQLEQRDFHFIPDPIATYLISTLRDTEMKVERSIFGGSICVLLKRADIEIVSGSNTFWKFVRSILSPNNDNSIPTGLFRREFLSLMNLICLKSFHFCQKLLDLLVSIDNRSLLKHPMICDILDFLTLGNLSEPAFSLTPPLPSSSSSSSPPPPPPPPLPYSDVSSHITPQSLFEAISKLKKVKNSVVAQNVSSQEQYVSDKYIHIIKRTLDQLIISPTGLCNLTEFFSSSLLSSINSGSFTSSSEGISNLSPIECRLLILFNHFYQKLSSESLNEIVISLIKANTFHQIIQIFCYSSGDVSLKLNQSIIRHLVKCDIAKKEIIKECATFLFSRPYENIPYLISKYLSSEELLYYFFVELGGFEKLMQMISETIQSFESEKLGMDFFFFFLLFSILRITFLSPR